MRETVTFIDDCCSNHGPPMRTFWFYEVSYQPQVPGSPLNGPTISEVTQPP